MRKFNEILLAIEIERALEKRRFLSCISTGYSWAPRLRLRSSLTGLLRQRHGPTGAWRSTPCWRASQKPPRATTRSAARGRQRAAQLDRRAHADSGYITAPSSIAEVLTPPVWQSCTAQQLAFARTTRPRWRSQEMLDRYGMSAYNDGYHVTPPSSTELQQVAQEALIEGFSPTTPPRLSRARAQRWPLAEDGETDSAGLLGRQVRQDSGRARQTPLSSPKCRKIAWFCYCKTVQPDELLWENGMLRSALP